MIYIGIDLAWSNKNLSALTVLEDKNIIEVSMADDKEIIEKILSYKTPLVGIDAPLKVNNPTGNRITETEFLKIFAKYKIGILPVNRNLLLKQFGFIKGEEIRKELEKEKFNFGMNEKNFIEIYPHSTISVHFNNYKILPYKRKKGRKIDDIKLSLKKYQNFLKQEFKHEILEIEIDNLKGAKLKKYEDMLDSITSAFTLYFCKTNPKKCKFFGNENEGLFVSLV
jgi:predicted RNase H-like nuclease